MFPVETGVTLAHSHSPLIREPFRHGHNGIGFGLDLAGRGEEASGEATGEATDIPDNLPARCAAGVSAESAQGTVRDGEDAEHYLSLSLPL